MPRHRYTLSEPCSATTADDMLGAIEVSFAAGDVEPRSEQEDLVLALLALRHPDLATRGEELPEAPPEGLPGQSLAASGAPGSSLPAAEPDAANTLPAGAPADPPKEA